MDTPEYPITTETKLKRIAWLSARDPNKQFSCLMHHINQESLRNCFNELDGRKAVGQDGIDKAAYAGKLEENLRDLMERMKKMAYRPEAVRQVQIPKDGRKKETRPIGIANLEDKIVQKMMAKILESIYEPLFLESSYGFRAGRGCHDAIRALHRHLFREEVQTIIDVDLANFFGTIDHLVLMEILGKRLRIRSSCGMWYEC